MNDNNITKIITPPNYRALKPITVGEIPQVYLDSLTYAEQILDLIKYIKDVVYPTLVNVINTTNENVELMNEALENFKTTLDSMITDIENFKTNLNNEWETYQTTVNNKLDEYEQLYHNFEMSITNQFTEFQNSINKNMSDFINLINSNIADINDFTNLIKTVTTSYNEGFRRELNEGMKCIGVDISGNDLLIKRVYDNEPLTSGNINFNNFYSGSSDDPVFLNIGGKIKNLPNNPNATLYFGIEPNSEQVYPLFTYKDNKVYFNKYNIHENWETKETIVTLQEEILIGEYMNYSMKFPNDITFTSTEGTQYEYMGYDLIANYNGLTLLTYNSKYSGSVLLKADCLRYYDDGMSMEDYPVYLSILNQYSSNDPNFPPQIGGYITATLYLNMTSWYNLITQFKSLVNTGKVDVTADFDPQFNELKQDINNLQTNINNLENEVNTDVTNLQTNINKNTNDIDDINNYLNNGFTNTEITEPSTGMSITGKYINVNTLWIKENWDTIISKLQSGTKIMTFNDDSYIAISNQSATESNYIKIGFSNISGNGILAPSLGNASGCLIYINSNGEFIETYPVGDNPINFSNPLPSYAESIKSFNPMISSVAGDTEFDFTPMFSIITLDKQYIESKMIQLSELMFKQNEQAEELINLATENGQQNTMISANTTAINDMLPKVESNEANIETLMGQFAVVQGSISQTILNEFNYPAGYTYDNCVVAGVLFHRANATVWQIDNNVDRTSYELTLSTTKIRVGILTTGENYMFDQIKILLYK